jgi:hypothetical protein
MARVILPMNRQAVGNVLLYALAIGAVVLALWLGLRS